RRAFARAGVDLRADYVAHAELSGFHLPMMADDVGLDFLRIVNRKQGQTNSALGELAAVSDLTARFGIERRAIEHDNPLLSGAERVDRGAIAKQRGDATLLRERFVAVEHGLGAGVRQRSARL